MAGPIARDDEYCQPNQISSFVLIPHGSERVRGFLKNVKSTISVNDFLIPDFRKTEEGKYRR